MHTVKHSRKHVNRDFIWASITTLTGIVSIAFDALSLFFQYGWLLIGAIRFYSYYFKVNHPHLILNEDILRQQFPFRTTEIQLADYLKIDIEAESFILSNGGTNRKINTWQLDQRELKTMLDKLPEFLDREDPSARMDSKSS